MPLSREIFVEDISPPKGRLLVAEDNAALRDYLVAVLRAEGYDVAEASTADDLLDTLAVSLCPDIGSGEFDLVIAEDRLVIRGGLTSKAWAHGKIPPLVLIGSLSGREDTPHALGAKAVVSFGRPLDIDSLRSAIRNLAEGAIQTRRAAKTMAQN